jgi:hypothetical protein
MSCMFLAAVIACGVPNTNADALDATDDGLSLAGMFFAKLETMRASLRSGDIGNVRLSALSYSKFMILMLMNRLVTMFPFLK